MKTTDKPRFQEFHPEGVKHINTAEAYKSILNNEAVLIDVREDNETSLSSIPLNQVLYHPMSVIEERLPFIAKDQQIILGCPGGVRSSKVAVILMQAAYPQVANLDGGFDEWKAQGLPFESNIKHH